MNVLVSDKELMEYLDTKGIWLLNEEGEWYWAIPGHIWEVLLYIYLQRKLNTGNEE